MVVMRRKPSLDDHPRDLTDPPSPSALGGKRKDGCRLRVADSDTLLTAHPAYFFTDHCRLVLLCLRSGGGGGGEWVCVGGGWSVGGMFRGVCCGGQGGGENGYVSAWGDWGGSELACVGGGGLWGGSVSGGPWLGGGGIVGGGSEWVCVGGRGSVVGYNFRGGLGGGLFGGGGGLCGGGRGRGICRDMSRGGRGGG